MTEPEFLGETIPNLRLEQFLQAIPNSSRVMGSRRDLVEHFAYFLTEELGEASVRPKRIKACFDAAAVSAPANIHDAMRKSNAFVWTTDGAKLSRDAKHRILDSLAKIAEPGSPTNDPLPQNTPSQKTQNVVVVHGRDRAIRDSMFDLLRALALNPVEWNEGGRRTARGSPYNGEVVDALFEDAQAVVVILSPDEHVALRRDLQGDDQRDNDCWQPRPNVFLEAGMALSRNEARTILVEIGSVRIPSDLHGRNLIKLDDSAAKRHSLVQRLSSIGCNPKTTGDDWLRVGHFSMRVRDKRGGIKT